MTHSRTAMYDDKGPFGGMVERAEDLAVREAGFIYPGNRQRDMKLAVRWRHGWDSLELPTIVA